MDRAFKGIWIPKEIWLDKDLSWVEKFLLVEIESLDNEEGCWASNEYFAKFFGISKDRVSKLISGLNKKGYITVKLIYKEGTKAVDRRVVKINYGYRRKQLEGIGENNYTPIGENNEDNNTSFNNTINNTKDILSCKQDDIPFKEIVGYLNQQANTNFKASGADTKKHIKARWNEKYRLEDFKKVIDIKVAEWNGTDMEKYLRPKTLFGSKFEDYLNQKTGQKKQFKSNKTARKEILPDWAREDYDYRAAEEEKYKKVGINDGELPEIDLDDELPF